MCGFEDREHLGYSYQKDPRWKEVSKLRSQGDHLEANGLVSQIRVDWGLEP